MNLEQANFERAYSYDLFSQFFQAGVNETTLPFIKGIPELAQTLPQDLDPDALAARHYDVLGMNIFPYASAYLDPELNLGGTISQFLEQFFSNQGYIPSNQENPDHLAVELDFLAYLSKEGQGDQIAVSFFTDHLLIWLPIFVDAVIRQEDDFYTVLSQLTLHAVLEHADQIGVPKPSFIGQLPSPPALANDQETDINRIAAFLTTPLYCGFFLSKASIAALGRDLKVPRGFGSRHQMLTNLLRSAADFDKLGDVFTQLIRIAESTTAFLSAQTMKQPITDFWQARLENTRLILEHFIDSLPKE